MHDTAHATQIATQPNPQLSLGTGPTLIARGRPRTDEDKAWYNDQLRIKHSKLLDKVIFERIAYYASLNPERIAFPSVARLASEVLCSPRTVQYALRRLEAAGLIQCVNRRKGGRATGRYHVLELRPRGARDAPKVISKEDQGLPNTLPFGRKSVPNLEGGSQMGQQPSEQLDLRPTVRRPPDNKGNGKRQLRYWYALQRKLGGLGEQFLQGQGQIFHRLPHSDKTRILNQLLSEERRGVESGSLEAFGSQQ